MTLAACVAAGVMRQAQPTSPGRKRGHSGPSPLVLSESPSGIHHNMMSQVRAGRGNDAGGMRAGWEGCEKGHNGPRS